MEVKTLSDDEKVKLSDDFARINLNDRDDVVFDFEADMRRVMKQVNIKKLMKKDKKYIKGLKKFIMNIVLQRYLVDIIKVGNKKVSRFNRFYVGA
jgi:hypothetical protein